MEDFLFSVLEAREMTVGERYPVDLDRFGEFLGKFTGIRWIGQTRLPGTVEYLGHRRVEGLRAAVVHVLITNTPRPLEGTYLQTDSKVTVWGLTMDRTIYLDPSAGFQIAEYRTFALDMEASQQALSIRSTCSTTLDRKSSSGL